MGPDETEGEVREMNTDAEQGTDNARTEEVAGNGVQAQTVEEAQEMKKENDMNWDNTPKEGADAGSPSEEREVSSIRFSEMDQGDVQESLMGLDFILDIPLTVSVELGRGKMMISELLKLGRGSIVELTKLAGEPLDVFVNNRLIAMGEVVLANEKFGVRLTDVVSHAERINQLK